MHGTIIFRNSADLASFLRHFTGSTAVFEVIPGHDDSGFFFYRLTFTGGY